MSAKWSPVLLGLMGLFLYALPLTASSTSKAIPKKRMLKKSKVKKSTPKPMFHKGMARIAKGFFIPLYIKKQKKYPVKTFWLDRYPVTNAQFLQFVKKNPRWRRSRVPRIFSDKTYLKHWKSDLELHNPEKTANSPVVNISWFPAKYYCQSQGKRLPTVAEWEYAASASQSQMYGQNEKGYNQRILLWYSRPTPKVLPKIGSTVRNYWGVYDLHGLVWEWTLNFNTALVTGESRGDSALDKALFCGSGAAGAPNPKNYAAFMRYAYRSSLKASYNTSNLGFRCARSTRP